MLGQTQTKTQQELKLVDDLSLKHMKNARGQKKQK